MVAGNVDSSTVSPFAGKNHVENARPEFGAGLLRHFLFHPSFHNLNHGSFGACPRDIQKRLRYYQDLTEARPDPFIRYDLPKLLDKARDAVSKLLNAPTETVVFVPNASMGINTVLRSLMWDIDGKDVILYFSSIYGACGKTIDYIVDSNKGLVTRREIVIDYPCEDEDILLTFQDAIRQCQMDGKRPRICLYDTVSSLPGVRFPFETITKACRDSGILSLIDGAQGIGQIQIDLTALCPDFFVTNCHKWLLTPRGSAVLYVPPRNQELIPSSIPTSHGYVSAIGTRFNPLPPGNKSTFVNNFQFVGTIDSSPYLCVQDAIKWREEVLGGEERIMKYTQWLAKEGGKRAAELLGTEVMDNESGTLTKCSMVNLSLPIRFAPPDGITKEAAPGVTMISYDEAVDVTQWMLETLIRDYETFIALFIHGNRMWARLSAQVYLELNDFEWAGDALLKLCERVAQREYKTR
ncbi:pyridoxal phosphate-dependent transferase [Xylariales sp. AK1849]|nr:pyridoxal phosphate-dependent transferase [Xylariales sp. AK1849]